MASDSIVHDPPNIEGYVLVKRERIPIQRVGLIGLLSAPLWALLFVGIAYALGGSPHIRLHITFFGVLIALLNLIVVMPALHEAIHGLTARLSGAHPTFGIGAGFAYTTFREPVRPIPYLVIGLAPLVVISAAGVALLVLRPVVPGQTLVFMVGNAAGALGDLWVVAKVLRLPRICLICDLADGFAFYLPKQNPMDPS
jgi:hypothetical protein